MGSENKMNDGTSFQQSDKPILCANGCGFFGTAATLDFCSKCYRDHCLKEQHAASAKAAVEKSLNSVPSPPSPKPKAEKVVETTELAAIPAVGKALEGSSSEVDKVVLPIPTPTPRTVAASRCGSCNKKVGLMGFKCRCGATFCGSHRYPEEHDCSFDFKGAGRDAIAKANPMVKADKVGRF